MSEMNRLISSLEEHKAYLEEMLRLSKSNKIQELKSMFPAWRLGIVQVELEIRRISPEGMIKLIDLPFGTRMSHIVRTRYFCYPHNVYTVADLFDVPFKDLMHTRNFGPRCLSELIDILKSIDLLPQDVSTQEMASKWNSDDSFKDLAMASRPSDPDLEFNLVDSLLAVSEARKKRRKDDR